MPRAAAPATTQAGQAGRSLSRPPSGVVLRASRAATRPASAALLRLDSRCARRGVRLDSRCAMCARLDSRCVCRGPPWRAAPAVTRLGSRCACRDLRPRRTHTPCSTIPSSIPPPPKPTRTRPRHLRTPYETPRPHPTSHPRNGQTPTIPQRHLRTPGGDPVCPILPPQERTNADNPPKAPPHALRETPTAPGSPFS